MKRMKSIKSINFCLGFLAAILVMTPRAEAFDGWLPQWPDFYSTRGNATFSAVSDSLLVSNVGSSGEDGLSVTYSELFRAGTLQYSPIVLSNANAGVAFELFGMVND